MAVGWPASKVRVRGLHRVAESVQKLPTQAPCGGPAYIPASGCDHGGKKTREHMVLKGTVLGLPCSPGGRSGEEGGGFCAI